MPIKDDCQKVKSPRAEICNEIPGPFKGKDTKREHKNQDADHLQTDKETLLRIISLSQMNLGKWKLTTSPHIL